MVLPKRHFKNTLAGNSVISYSHTISLDYWFVNNSIDANRSIKAQVIITYKHLDFVVKWQNIA